MFGGSVVQKTLVFFDGYEDLSLTTVAAATCLAWYSIVAVVSVVGYVQIWRFWSSPRPRAKLTVSSAPHVTVIRPVKGLEPRLYDCLASTFRQDYPLDKLHVRFCVSSRSDAAHPLLETLLHDFPAFDAQILVEEDDEAVRSGQLALGPNPKIRNMSRAYREAPSDVVWIIDCNVWVPKGVLGRMVATLEGHGSQRRAKFVHIMPLVVDINSSRAVDEAHGGLLDSGRLEATAQITPTTSSSADPFPRPRTASSVGGGRLEEVFMSLMHAKFYTAFQTILIAPATVGKSTMFRRSHLNSITGNAGIDYFSKNICEDQLLGDLMWKKRVPEELQGEKMVKHALCFGDLVIQPMSSMSIVEYWNRRVRWLRVRKFTVTLATFVEPGVEPFLCSLYGAFALTTLPYFHQNLGIPQTWTALALIWLANVVAWCLVDRRLFLKLQSGASIECDQDTPFFARPPEHGRRRPFGQWLLAWLGREALALPIWAWAFWCGTEVVWRGKRFRVGMDMKVHEIGGSAQVDTDDPTNVQHSPKARRD